jgi:hypothetical protein
MQTDDSLVKITGPGVTDNELAARPSTLLPRSPMMLEDEDSWNDFEPIAIHPVHAPDRTATYVLLAAGLAIAIVPVLVWFVLVMMAIAPTLLPILYGFWDHCPWVVLGVVLYLGAALLLSLRAKKTSVLPPTHLAITPVGLFGRRGESNWGGLTVLDLPWGSVLRVSVEAEGRGRPNQVLCFHTRDGSIKQLNSEHLFGQKIRRRLLLALKEFAKHVEVDPEVYALLGSQTEASYTEIWISALSAPPNRRRVLPLEDGTFLSGGKYKITQSVGSGGQGTAYTALVMKTGSTVVLKEYILPIHVRTGAKKSALASLEKEVRLLEKLDHPQIVKVLDFFVEDHRGYVVLEHVKGVNLRELVETNGCPGEAKTIEFAKSMCTILACLHGQTPPLIHRDFTPDNLIVQEDGSLKLVDFNVAQYMDDTKSALVMGKRAYMPPEQFRGKAVTQSDLYAFGGSLFFLLTGEDPEPLSVSHPKEIKGDVSDKLDSIVAKLTQLKFEDRYQSGNDALSDLLGIGPD